MSKEDITIVINTFKSDEKINTCLESIDNSYKVILIENSKNNEFKKQIESKYPNVQCYLSGENLGYAKGNNFGLAKVKSKYALILNPDAKLENDTLEKFLITAKKIKNFSIIGPAKQDEYSKNFQNHSKEELIQVNYLKGFAMFLNLEEFEQIGFFDENFFIYLEEMDLCKRLIKEGKKIYLDKKIIIHHLGGSSHNKSINFEMELSRNWHWMWSTFYFNKKHFGYLNSLIKVFPKFLSSFFKIIFYFLIFNSEKKKIYFQRFSGLYNSMIGKKSWYRPKILSD